MKRKSRYTIVLLLSLSFANFGFSQTNLSAYDRLVSEGTMPKVLHDIFSLEGKKEEDLVLKRMCQSGKIVYGSALNRYLDNILDKLLVNDPRLRSEITLFVVKSPEVNAFAMNRGIILVNIGFLAQVTNEAEIAFVLAHELVHIAEKHEPEMKKGRDIDAYLSYHNRSREKENEADRLALERYFAASNYSYKAIDGAFDVLQYAYLPFDNITFKRSAVETDFYKFDDKYFLKNIKPIHSREDYIDTLSTHPNLQKRRTAANNFISNKNDDGRELFVQSKELFEEVRAVARFESIRQYLTMHNYGKAYYNAYLLSQSLPENIFLQNAMAVAVYGLSKHKHDGSLRDVLVKHAEIEGEMQQVYFFFGELSRKELSVLTVRHLWSAHKRSPQNSNLTKMLADAVKDMIKENNLFLNDFSDYPQGAEIAEDTASTDDAPAQSDTRSKYDKLKTVQTKVKPTAKFTTLNYMLVDLKQDSTFINLAQQVKNEIEDEEVIAIVKFADGERKGIGTDGLLLLDPTYHFIKKDKIDFEKSVKGKNKLTKTLTKSSNRLNINLKNMQDEQLKNFDTKEYNNYCKLKDWLTDLAQIKGSMVYYQNEGISALADDLDCKYLALTSVGVKSGKFITFNKFSTLVSSAFCPVIFPAYLGKFLAPRRMSSAYFAAIELETGKTIYAKAQTTESGYSQEALTNAFIYDCLYLLKNGGKSNAKKK
ncbi:MAG: M48 family metallopeptidase [Lentimicrobiaceae bacterium]|nr:M48 family metallopeptidase [Lentimicrobiaceae bacterium]